jgi:uncharacterized protein
MLDFVHRKTSSRDDAGVEHNFLKVGRLIRLGCWKMQWEVEMHYLLFYEVSDDYITRRAQYRDAHLAKAWAASERDELVLGGALANPPDAAILLFQGDSPAVAEQFAKEDPYVLNGVVKRWYVREWTTVVGREAATPVRPTVGGAKANH